MDYGSQANRERSTIRTLGLIGTMWGIAGFLMLLGIAVVHLLGPAVAAFYHPLLWYHWLALAGMVASLLYFKGFRIFQRGLSTRVICRARDIRQRPSAARVALAPLYCMGFFGAGTRRQITMVFLTLAMVAFVFLFRYVGQPWRGMIDLAVAAALAWGFIATVVLAIRAK
jgi:hypothetical protein